MKYIAILFTVILFAGCNDTTFFDQSERQTSYVDSNNKTYQDAYGRRVYVNDEGQESFSPWPTPEPTATLEEAP